MVRGRTALYREDTTVGNGLADHRFHHRAVGAEYSSFGSELGNLAGNVFHDELLGTGNTCITGRIGSILFHETQANLLSFCFHEVAASAEHLIGHVAGERVVNQSGCTHVLCLLSNLCSACKVIGLQNHITLGSDHIGIFARNAEDEKDIGANFANTIDCSCCTRNSLHHDNRLHLRIRSHSHHVADGSFLLLHETIGIGGDDNLVSIDFFHVLCCTELFLTLTDGTSHDTNLILGRSSFLCTCCKHK
ncbi:hypothetical protein SDC9_77299 [bioreactor metagenome]|uniref:NAD-specific glutamate dehydrogenase n=1 Tax=bioreactor metagenome TaxID=1076179 RepID=A0A644YR18_9ZZZZ